MKHIVDMALKDPYHNRLCKRKPMFKKKLDSIYFMLKNYIRSFPNKPYKDYSGPCIM